MKLSAKLTETIVYAVNNGTVYYIEINTPNPTRVVVGYLDFISELISISFENFNIVIDKKGEIVEVTIFRPERSDMLQKVQKVLKYLTGE